jgi:transcriptional regulator with XRE-family HTH domain
MNVGQKIKQLRLENNLTQEELAEQLGVSFQSVSRWENSTTYPDITMLPIIANMFDVTIDYLLDMDSYKKKDEIDKILKQVDILFNEGKTKEREVILENALKKYPNNWNIKYRLMND